MAAGRILTLTAWCTALAASAHASPRSDPTLGRAVFTGATQGSPTSVSLSPGALGELTSTQTYIAFTPTLMHTSIDAPGTRVNDSTLGYSGHAAIVWKSNERIRLGAEFRKLPSDVQLENYDELKYFTLGGFHRTYSAAIAVNIKASNSLFVGAALAHENTTLRLRYARDTALADGQAGLDSDCGGSPCGLGNAQATEVYDVYARSSTVSASNLKLTLGLMVRLSSNVWIAAAYHTPPGLSLQTTLEGDVQATRAPRDGGATVTGGATATFSLPASVDAEIRARIPYDLDATVGGRWEDTSRLSAYDIRGFGTTYARNGFPEGMLRTRGLHDSFAIWGGAQQVDRGEQLRFGARIGFETAALRNERSSPLTFWPRSFTFDAGVQIAPYRGSPSVFQISYGLAYFPDVNVTDPAFDPQQRVDCIDSGFDYATPACAATRNGYAIDSNAGTYGQFQHALRIGWRRAWL